MDTPKWELTRLVTWKGESTLHLHRGDGEDFEEIEVPLSYNDCTQLARDALMAGMLAEYKKGVEDGKQS